MSQTLLNEYVVDRRQSQEVFSLSMIFSFKMNFSTRQSANVIIDSVIITLSSASVCISFGMFGFIVYHLIKRTNSSQCVALLLTANMYFALLLTSILSFIEKSFILPKHLYALILTSYDGTYCQIRGYLAWTLLCAIYYSNSLQAIYRLCRIIFHRKRALQSIRLYYILVIIQWIVCCLLVLPAPLLDVFQYSIDDYYCQIEYTNFRSLLIFTSLAYAIPMNITIGCYIYTMKKIRRGNKNFVQTMTQITVNRDLIVLFRICLLLGLIAIVSIPLIITYLIYIFTRSIPWCSAPIQ
jgi:hypothetical protein